MTAKWLQNLFRRRQRAEDDTTPQSDWRDLLGKDELSKEQFCALCADAMRDLFPEIVVEPGDAYDEFRIRQKDREPSTVFLENLWRNTRRHADLRAQEVERFLRVFGRLESSDDRLPQLDCIVPMIKDEGYFNLYPNLSKAEAPFANEHLVGDLWIVYAIDMPDKMLTLQKSHLSELGVSMQELKELAISNLRRILPPIETHGEGPVYWLSAGTDYVASLLLFDDVWADLKTEFSGEILAAVPSRDVLLFTNSGSSDGLEHLKVMVSRLMESGSYLISSTILKRCGDRWEVFSLT